jgi:hypothetical protein
LWGGLWNVGVTAFYGCKILIPDILFAKSLECVGCGGFCDCPLMSNPTHADDEAVVMNGAPRFAVGFDLYFYYRELRGINVQRFWRLFAWV